MEDLSKLVDNILNEGYLMSLGVLDEGGVWVSDVIYVHDDKKNLYWVSDPEVRHSQAVEKNKNAAATITVSNNPGEQNIGLQIQGQVKKIEGEVFDLAAKHRLKRKKAALQKDELFLEDGECWYQLIPKKIDIIYEPKFGFEKQHIEL